MILKFSYILLTIIVLLIIIRIGFKTINKTFSKKKKITKKKIQLITGLLLWQAYIIAIGISKVLETFELPPRLPLFLILPTFLFTGIFLYKNRNNTWIKNISPESLIYFQTFRIAVETIFVFSVTAGVLVKDVTIEGYNYDMVLAFTAPFIAYLVFKKKNLPVRIAILWNYLGLVILASVIVIFITNIYMPELYEESKSLMPLEFTKYPYTLVAGFLMPSAVFFHILSIIQLSKKK